MASIQDPGADLTPAQRSVSWRRSYPAPAKLNLFLHVVARRNDGYHLLQTLFRLIDLSDTLRFSLREDDQIRLATEIPGLPQGDDLCVRAASALRAAAGMHAGVDIHLDKRIPIGGGLGGGSSDAATTLLVLNRLWELGLTREELMPLSLGLGADVPFFLLGENAFGEGAGEVLTPVDLPQAWYVVLVPPVAVPTVAIFAAPELTRNTKTITISSFSAGVGGVGHVGERLPSGDEKFSWPGPHFGHNDLEPVVCNRYPQVAQYLEWLRAHGAGSGGGTIARMSGSGACVFAEFATEGEARSVVSSLPAGMRGFAVRGLDRHPLQAMLEEG